jgi:hypothetical protein
MALGQAALDQGADLKDLEGLIRRGDPRVTRLVIVPGLTDLVFDLYCTGGGRNTYTSMTTFLPEDLVKIRAGVAMTCGSEDRFNALIAEYIRAAAGDFRDTVRSPQCAGQRTDTHARTHTHTQQEARRGRAAHRPHRPPSRGLPQLDGSRCRACRSARRLRARRTSHRDLVAAPMCPARGWPQCAHMPRLHTYAR